MKGKLMQTVTAVGATSIFLGMLLVLLQRISDAHNIISRTGYELLAFGGVVIFSGFLSMLNKKVIVPPAIFMVIASILHSVMWYPSYFEATMDKDKYSFTLEARQSVRAGRAATSRLEIGVLVGIVGLILLALSREHDRLSDE
jgi:hypothetical protein